MRLVELAETSMQVGATRSRHAKTERLAKCIRRLASEEAGPAVAYLAGVVPQGRLGIGHAVVGEMRSVPPAQEPTLELRDVHAALRRLAAVRGPGAGAARRDQLKDLFAHATASEQSFLRRLLLGELRQGALESVVLDAVAQAAGVSRGVVRRARMLEGNLGEIARTALFAGEEGLARFSLRLFAPIQPMLAQTAESVSEALVRLGGRAAFEPKLDGVRIQLHRVGNEVRLFSRRLHDITAAVPELVESALVLPVREVVLDGEALAFGEDGRPRPFQVTMRRFGRKLDVDPLRRELPLAARYFDCLHVDGKSLLDVPAADRWSVLVERIPDAERVARLVTDDSEEASAFYGAALEAGHEGLVAKALDAPYAAGSRGASWLKIKQAHTLDLVVLAAEWGSGRRRGWLSNLHLGARDPTTGAFVMLGKTFKGMTDETLAWQTRRLLELETGRERHVVFVRPALVVEVAFNDIQRSPQYPGGLALRFARLRRYRSDKDPQEADTVDDVRALAGTASTPGP